MKEIGSLDVFNSYATPPDMGETVPGSHPNEFGELKQLIKQKGLLDKQPAYYTFKISLTLCLLAAGVAFMVVVDNPWLQLLNAVFLAVVFVQISFVGHDAGHQQIFHEPWKNDVIGLAITLLLGVSRTWWIDKHNRHHANPNQLLLDPDTFIPVLAYSENQALSKKGVYRFIVKYQAGFLFPLLCLEGIGVRLASAQYLLHKIAKYRYAEPLFLAISLVPYLGLPFYLFSPWQAVLFLLVHQTLFGLYIGSVFAPNHKGMPILQPDSQMDFLRRQVLTSRNVKAQPLTDFWYGGLNYQIEHHLFPSMPRNKLRETQKIVKAFCEEHSIAYHETAVLQSYQEILRYLHRVSAPLRETKPLTPGRGIPSTEGGE